MKGDMMDYFSFDTDEEGIRFFSEVIEYMTGDLGISEREAVTRVNLKFVGMDLPQDHIVFHRSAEYWARDIVFGHDARWKPDADSEPLPAPSVFEHWLTGRWWWVSYWRRRRRRQLADLIRKNRDA
ncbi:hypothetical protein [Nocardia jiangsuensis]|uniref:Uncharacterized protein n=1 Tax=Nocardia jiangsuensis TaxID=1691563 RepID=A0ABV8DWR2_9NOCA